MLRKERLNLAPSESAVFRAAAQIYSAYVISGRVEPNAEAQWLERSLEEAIRLALRAEARIQSDDEVAG